MELVSNPEVKIIFDNYPDFIKDKMLFLRALLIKVASDINDLDKLEETIKWVEPSILAKNTYSI